MTGWDKSDWIEDDEKALSELSTACPNVGWTELGRRFASLTSLRAIPDDKRGPALRRRIEMLERKRRGEWCVYAVCEKVRQPLIPR